jgi:CIC family chloride channel protein
MTRNYQIILPLMTVVVITTLVAGRIFPQSIYTHKLFKRGIEIRGGRDVNILRAHRVDEIMDRHFDAIPAALTLREIFHRVKSSRESYLIVNDRDGYLKGVLSIQNLRQVLSEPELDVLVVAQDLISPDPVTIASDDTLESAYKVFAQRDFDLIPIVTRAEPRKVVGVIRRETLTGYYNKQLIETLRR